MWRVPARALRKRPWLARKQPATYTLQVPIYTPLAYSLRRFSAAPDDAKTAEQVQVLEDLLRQQLAEGLPGTRADEAYAIAFTCNALRL